MTQKQRDGGARICQRSMRLLSLMLFGALLLGIVFAVIASSKPDVASASVFGAKGIIGVQPVVPVSPGETSAFNPNPPDGVVKLVFIHHSCGANWLDDGNGDLGATLGNNNYYVSDTYYGWGPDSIGSKTDIGHWWLWFRGPYSNTYLSALYSTTSQNATYTRPMADPGGENEVIMFKSCYPNSNLGGEPDEPPTTGDNPLRGQAASSSHHTVGNAKGIYNDLLEYFGTRQDRLFVVIAAPPVLDETYADNARAFNNWLVEDWLDDYLHHNVVVFDFYNVLTTNGGDAYTNDYGLSTGNHHRVATATIPTTIEHITDGDDDASPNVLEYPTGGTNNHPSSAGNQKATGEFVPLLNAYYNCWKHGDCWDGSSDWISVTAISEVTSVYPGGAATYTLLVRASAGFSVPVSLALQEAPSGALASFDPNPVAPPGSSCLYVTTTASTMLGTYGMTVTGTSGEVSGTAFLTLTVKPALTLTAKPEVRAVLPGDTAAYTLSVAASAGFTAPVTLTLEGSPSATVVSIVPNPVTPPGSSQVQVTITPSTAAGIYPMTVTGTTGASTGAADLTLIVASASPPSFTLSISPTTRVAEPSQAVSYTATVAGMNGFSQPVTLTAAGFPTDVEVVWGVNPVIPGGFSVLTLLIPSSPPFGDYMFYVVGMTETEAVTESARLIIEYPFKSHLPIILR
jgi:hypothetical protein